MAKKFKVTEEETLAETKYKYVFIGLI